MARESFSIDPAFELLYWENQPTQRNITTETIHWMRSSLHTWRTINAKGSGKLPLRVLGIILGSFCALYDERFQGSRDNLSPHVSTPHQNGKTQPRQTMIEIHGRIFLLLSSLDHIPISMGRFADIVQHALRFGLSSRPSTNETSVTEMCRFLAGARHRHHLGTECHHRSSSPYLTRLRRRRESSCFRQSCFHWKILW